MEFNLLHGIIRLVVGLPAALLLLSLVLPDEFIDAAVEADRKLEENPFIDFF